MNWILRIALASVGLAAALSLWAEDAEDAEDYDALLANLRTVLPDGQVKEVSKTAVDGLVVVEYGNGQLLYGTADGRHLLLGDLLEFGADGLVNRTEERRAVRRRDILSGVDPDEMVIFSPKDQVKASVSVFTDVDCGYCRKLHQEIDELNALGIEVRYLAFPRAGPGSRSFEKTVSAWCSDNRHKAITELKLGNSIPDRSCPNPVQAQYELGSAVGVTGTPALVTEDGQLLPGYMPAAQLADALGL